MRKTIPTKDELERIVRLRQAGNAWTEIANNSRFDRRTVRRIYDEWQRTTTVGEMDVVRRASSRDEFERHLDAMAWLAEGLVAHLSLEDAVKSTLTAEEHLQTLWRETIPDRLVPGRASARGEPTEGQTVRRNQLLFRAVMKHTGDDFDWKVLDGWKVAWDAWARLRPAREKAALAAVRRMFRASPDLEDRIVMGVGAPSPVERLAEVALEALSRGLLSGSVDDATRWVAGKPSEDGGKEALLITLGGDDSHIPFRLDTEGMEEDFVDIYRKMIISIWDSNAAAKRMEAAAEKLRKAEAYFSERLDPLLLRPMTIRTKCDLCPA